MPEAEPASILLTGFAPFDGAALNSSWEIARALDGVVLQGHRIAAAQLPVAFGDALELLFTQLRRQRPQLVLCLGLAGGRAAMAIERIGINLIDAPIPDNQGCQPVDVPVVPGGPAAYFTSLPVKRMLRAMRAAGVPVELSQSAGTYVCNQVLYGLLHGLQTLDGGCWHGVRCGFVHVPWLPGQGSPALPLEDMVRALRVALLSALECDGCGGAAITAGALH
ncbi:pyroglutamyl-peptidase I [Corticibacter populi]|uniref:Pyroglutamyl-peptidase I n=1 Tax=Corticibacter populi TaxID=1550736 RepID=A0A3M6QTX8_9BURK|nr:pyroglutamyl-peptidase I [Corticibacter populi]RMX05932.1 pyroglutamyl-peptidase I [Corticibacter populi]RZS30744.1 pyroglutamyl-peptidase I [Corticibacter populi]